MGVVRNCIDIIGITPENELPDRINGQHIEASETENLLIDSNIKIKNIYQIIVHAEIKDTRVINTPLNRIVVIDGFKKFKIAYYDMDNNMGVIELNSPFNLFFDIESSAIETEKINLYIADTYFELLNYKILYCHIIYILDIHYFGDVRRNENEAYKNKKEELKEQILSEMSISKDIKRDFNETVEKNITFKNNLIDIDAEYL
ncbi:hypothetical protein M2651_01020 [Clostridium sp. SYSU_GA19001]|uniref:hypothetical protein n=1 Tax=Clostridium caldaquaticum TaxID=2940653 RepID=UPI002076F8D2|nr:hypothetical protein [Clostridium caldaquaticum]MCM8709601.1 hypothetical protein [Clostridium caldaquaticum]